MHHCHEDVFVWIALYALGLVVVQLTVVVVEAHIKTSKVLCRSRASQYQEQVNIKSKLIQEQVGISSSGSIK
jgi:hypothetical protein